MASLDRVDYYPGIPTPGFPGVYEVSFDTFDIPAPQSSMSAAPSYAGGEQPTLLGTLGSDTFGNTARRRPTVLTQETWRLYNAMSFLTWHTGLCFNAHITLTADALGFTNHADFVRLMPMWHKEMNRCLFNGDEKERKRKEEGWVRKRMGKRAGRIAPHRHYWISVVEYARDQGLHVHVLCVVPERLQAAFEEKTWDWWRKHSPGKVALNGIAWPKRNPKESRKRYELQATLFRYLVKTTGENLTRADHQGKIWSARQIFRPNPTDCTPVLVQVPQLAGICHELNHTAQDRAGFVSRYNQRLLDQVYSGWELDAYDERVNHRKWEHSLQTLDI